MYSRAVCLSFIALFVLSIPIFYQDAFGAITIDEDEISSARDGEVEYLS